MTDLLTVLRGYVKILISYQVHIYLTDDKETVLVGVDLVQRCQIAETQFGNLKILNTFFFATTFKGASRTNNTNFEKLLKRT